MEKHTFYHNYANTPLPNRDTNLSNDPNNLFYNTTLSDVYNEIHNIDNKLRTDEIRRDKLLSQIEPHLEKVTLASIPYKKSKLLNI